MKNGEKLGVFLSGVYHRERAREKFAATAVACSE
jgi:hypothetical protein